MNIKYAAGWIRTTLHPVAMVMAGGYIHLIAVHIIIMHTF